MECSCSDNRGGAYSLRFDPGAVPRTHVALITPRGDVCRGKSKWLSESTGRSCYLFVSLLYVRTSETAPIDLGCMWHEPKRID